MKFGKISLLIVGLINRNPQGIQLKEKGINFEELGSKLGNLTFVALNKGKTN